MVVLQKKLIFQIRRDLPLRPKKKQTGTSKRRNKYTFLKVILLHQFEQLFQFGDDA